MPHSRYLGSVGYDTSKLYRDTDTDTRPPISEAVSYGELSE